MIYLVILGVGLASAAIAVPMTILALRWIERVAESPSPLPEPHVEPPALTPDRVDRIARRGRR